MTSGESERAGGKLRVLDRGVFREVRLNRPAVHNALDEELISALTVVFRELREEAAAASAGSSTRAGVEPDPAGSFPRAGGGPDVDSVASFPRAVLLSAEGRSFCAGADVHYMRRVASYSVEENLEDARRLSALFQAMRDCPLFIVGRIQGATLGGGTGLAACCDLAVASVDARFGFTEVRLGIIPSVISPFVLDRIGAAHGRTLFPTGEIFGAAEALRIGLIDRVASPDRLDATIDAVAAELRAAAPLASREAKAIVARVAPRLPLSLPRAFEPGPGATGAGTSSTEPEAAPAPELEAMKPATQVSSRSDGALFEETARTIARLRASAEAREGMAAFLEKRPARWNRDPKGEA